MTHVENAPQEIPREVPQEIQRGAKRRSSKRKQPRSAGSLLAKAFTRCSTKNAYLLVLALMQWEDLAGSKISTHCEPHSYQEGVLWLITSSSAWQQEITYLKTILIDKLNRAAGKKIFKDIRVRSATFSRKDTSEKEIQLPELPSHKESHIAQTARVIEDPELRVIFERTMRRNLQQKALLLGENEG